MRGLFFAIGGIVVVVGIFLLLEAIGVLGGTSLSGVTDWAIPGGLLIIFGALLLWTQSSP